MGLGFIVEDRYLPLPTSMALKILHLAEKESHRLTVVKCATYNISLTLVNRIIKYNLRLKWMLVCCGCPLPGSRLIVPLLSVFFIRVFSPINISSFLRKHLTQACSSITFAVSKLLIKYLSSTVNLVVAEEIYMMPELHYRYHRIFIYQFSNFCIGEI